MRPPSPAEAHQTVHAEIPLVSGDPAAARLLARACLELASEVSHSDHIVLTVVEDLTRRWTGAAATAIGSPTGREHRSAGAVEAALREAAAGLTVYAERLEHAHHHHGFSLGKLLTLGAIIVVSAAALTVTLGAATVVEAAAATAAIEAATEAAGAAATAETGLAGLLAEAMESVAWLRPLLTFLAPKLPQVVVATGLQSGADEWSRSRIDWRDVTVAGASTVLGMSVQDRAVDLLPASVGVASAQAATTTLLARSAPYAIGAGVWGGVAAGDEELLSGRVDLLTVGTAGASAGLSEAGLDTVREHEWLGQRPPRDYRREALIKASRQPGRIIDRELARSMATLRATDRELLRDSVDLRASEGAGHTLRRHVDPDLDGLRARLAGQRRIRLSSGYDSQDTANSAVRYALRTQRDTVRQWIDSGTDSLTLRAFVPFDAGVVVDRGGVLHLSRYVRVVLRRDSLGRYVLTSFPDLPPR